MYYLRTPLRMYFEVTIAIFLLDKTQVVVFQVWEGTNVVKTGRVMLGETNPVNSLPGTIRGDFCIEVGRLVGQDCF